MPHIGEIFKGSRVAKAIDALGPIMPGEVDDTGLRISELASRLLGYWFAAIFLSWRASRSLFGTIRGSGAVADC